MVFFEILDCPVWDGFQVPLQQGYCTRPGPINDTQCSSCTRPGSINGVRLYLVLRRIHVGAVRRALLQMMGGLLQNEPGLLQ
jgi:hypothetical protein